MTSELAKLHAFLFVQTGFVSTKAAANFVGCSELELTNLLADLEQWLRSSGVEIIKVENQMQLVVSKELSQSLNKHLKGEKLTLSPASLEVLAIITHSQPIARGEIDEIRGVGSDQAVRNVLAMGLIAPEHAKQSGGEPIRYVTTPSFLRRVGIKTIKEITKS